MADDLTEELPQAKVDIKPLSTWTTDHLATRFGALTPVNTRKANGVDKAEAKALFDLMAGEITERDRTIKALNDGKERIARSRADERGRIRELEDQIAGLKGEPTSSLPTRAVAEVKDATRYGEHGVDLIVAEARRRGELIIEAAQTKAAAILGSPEPVPTNDPPTDFAADVEWLTSEIPVVERRLVDLRNRKAARAAEAERRQAELARWGQVLPIAQRQLTAGALEVSEVAS
jgi:hypothetical protein